MSSRIHKHGSLSTRDGTLHEISLANQQSHFLWREAELQYKVHLMKDAPSFIINTYSLKQRNCKPVSHYHKTNISMSINHEHLFAQMVKRLCLLWIVTPWAWHSWIVHFSITPSIFCGWNSDRRYSQVYGFEKQQSPKPRWDEETSAEGDEMEHREMLRVLEHINLSKDFQCRPQFDVHGAHEMILLQEQQGLAVDLLRTELFGDLLAPWQTQAVYLIFIVK